jgi:hypothetical protein
MAGNYFSEDPLLRMNKGGGPAGREISSVRSMENVPSPALLKSAFADSRPAKSNKIITRRIYPTIRILPGSFNQRISCFNPS